MENIEIEQEIIAEKKSISHLRTFMIFFLIAVILGASYSYYRLKKHGGRQMVDAIVFDTRLQNIENAIPIHEKRILKLEDDAKKSVVAAPATGAEAAKPTVDVAQLNDKVAALEKQVAQLKGGGGTLGKDKIYSAITLLSSFHRLSDKVLSGKPFTAELSSFQENFAEPDNKVVTDAVTALTPYSENGVPSVSQLLSSFEDSLDSMKTSESLLPENAGFWQTLLFNLSHMITIRKIDKNQTGNSIDAITGRAEDHLEQQEVEAAIVEVKTLPDNVRGSFAAWIEDAQINTLAPSLMDQIEEQVMKKAFDGAASPDKTPDKE